MATKQPTQPSQQAGENGDTLTAADEQALDTAWASITDEEMAASVEQTMQWGAEREKKQQNGE